jgi:hypothetical protein
MNKVNDSLLDAGLFMETVVQNWQLSVFACSPANEQ